MYRNKKRIMACNLLALFMYFLCNQVFAYGAVAYSRQTGYTYVATEYGDSAAASLDAMRGCSLKAKECELQLGEMPGNSVIAIAKGNSGAGFASHAIAKLAFDNALVECRKKSTGCSVVAIYWNPKISYSAFAKHQGDENSSASFFAFGYADKREAEVAALKDCGNRIPKEYKSSNGISECTLLWSDSENNKFAKVSNGEATFTSTDGDKPSLKEVSERSMARCKKSNPKIASNCHVVDAVENPKMSPKPFDFDSVYAMTDMGKKSVQEARTDKKPVSRSQKYPAASTNHVTCKNRCVNGSCIRTFPNGKTERWNAPRVFDPISGDWKWETSSCGN